MQPAARNKAPEAIDLCAEMEGIAAGIHACYLIAKEWDSPSRQYDQPTGETMGEVLFGLERHLLRVSEDFLIYTELLEGQIKDQIRAGKGADNA